MTAQRWHWFQDRILGPIEGVFLLAAQGRMKLLAIVKDPDRIARYLAAIGEPTEAPRRSPKRGPPYWKSRVLRRLARGDEHTSQGADETA
jgi:hypothetical protein